MRLAPLTSAAPSPQRRNPVAAQCCDWICDFWAEEDGASLVEYGVLITMIAIAVMGAILLMSQTLSSKLASIATCLSTGVCG